MNIIMKGHNHGGKNRLLWMLGIAGLVLDRAVSSAPGARASTRRDYLPMSVLNSESPTLGP
jgi:hypothetical protein